MAFDISEQESAASIEDEGVDMQVLDINDEPAFDADGKPVTIRVCGANSQAHKDALRWQRKALRAFGMAKPTPAEEDALQDEFVARCCKGWSGFTDNGAPEPFTTPNATNMFRRNPFVRFRVVAFMGSHANFLPKTPTL